MDTMSNNSNADGYAGAPILHPGPTPIMSGVDGLVITPQDMGGIDGEAGKLGGPFVDIIWPGWPPRLPTPGTPFQSLSVALADLCSHA